MYYFRFKIKVVILNHLNIYYYNMIFDNIVVKIVVIKNNIDLNNPLNDNSRNEVSGTGFFIFKHLIITCYHVVEYEVNIKVIYKNNIKKKAIVKYIFPDDDIAILEIIDEEPIFHNIQLLDFKIIKKQSPGKVYTIGFPMDSNNIIKTEGIISGFQESYIQTDAAINPGNSGGPLILFDKKTNKYKIIGVNVSKLEAAENTNFVVPSYRILILLKKIFSQKCLKNDIVFKKPKLMFDYQNLEQQKLINYFKIPNKQGDMISNKQGDIIQNKQGDMISNKQGDIIQNKQGDMIQNKQDIIPNKQGIMITNINKNYYLSKFFKTGDILLSINGNSIDYNGYVKIDFYPEKILINELGLWFIEGDELTFEILSNDDINFIKIKLEIINKNIMSILPNYPKYFISKNNLIFSIITTEHFDKLNNLKLNQIQKITIINRYLRQIDLFTVYLAGLENDIYKEDFNEFPIGDIIIEINDNTFNNYEEFINIMKNDIFKIKTINNEIYFI